MWNNYTVTDDESQLLVWLLPRSPSYDIGKFKSAPSKLWGNG